MHGHHWQQAEGTIVSRQYEQMELPGQHGMHFVAIYDIDVRTADGTGGAENVLCQEHLWLDPGTVVRLEINSKTGEIRLHQHWPDVVISSGGPVPARAVQDASLPATPPPVPAAGTADFGQLFGGAIPAGADVHVVGGEQAAEILRQVMSGDPADRAAMKEQLRHLIAGQEAGGRPAPGT
jgi:hypothetical protein